MRCSPSPVCRARLWRGSTALEWRRNAAGAPRRGGHPPLCRRPLRARGDALRVSCGAPCNGVRALATPPVRSKLSGRPPSLHTARSPRLPLGLPSLSVSTPTHRARRGIAQPVDAFPRRAARALAQGMGACMPRWRKLKLPTPMAGGDAGAGAGTGAGAGPPPLASIFAHQSAPRGNDALGGPLASAKLTMFLPARRCGGRRRPRGRRRGSRHHSGRRSGRRSRRSS